MKKGTDSILYLNNNTILVVYSIYTYFLFSSTYSFNKLKTIFVTVVSCCIAMIFKSFINCLGALMDRCTWSSAIFITSLFLVFCGNINIC